MRKKSRKKKVKRNSEEKKLFIKKDITKDFTRPKLRWVLGVQKFFSRFKNVRLFKSKIM